MLVLDFLRYTGKLILAGKGERQAPTDLFALNVSKRNTNMWMKGILLT
jgi:hypothetical protein